MLSSDELTKLEREYEQIEDQHQDELLSSVLPLSQKVAFLSTLRWTKLHGAAGTGPSTSSARYDLDSYMVASIFKFAAGQLRRRVVWATCNEPDGDDEENEDESGSEDSDGDEEWVLHLATS